MDVRSSQSFELVVLSRDLLAPAALPAVPHLLPTVQPSGMLSLSSRTHWDTWWSWATRHPDESTSNTIEHYDDQATRGAALRAFEEWVQGDEPDWDRGAVQEVIHAEINQVQTSAQVALSYYLVPFAEPFEARLSVDSYLVDLEFFTNMDRLQTRIREHIGLEARGLVAGN